MMGSWFVRFVVPPVLTFVVITAAAEVIVRESGVKAYLVPAPSAVAQAAWVHREGLARALWETTQAAGVGFAISAVGGIAAGVCLSLSRRIRNAVYPYAIFFQTVPIIAIAPLLVIWLGYGLRAVTASACIVSIFPVIANTLAGMVSVDPALRDLFRLYGASAPARLFKLSLPWATPQIITGLRVAAGLAVIGAIVGEFIAGGGLGMYLQANIRAQNTDRIFAAILLATLLGLALFGMVNLIGIMLLRHWHASEQADRR